LKIWISSLFSNDVHELLLYLLRIKNLYFELVNRYYLVYSKFASLKYYYLINKTNKLIWIKRNMKRRKILKRKIQKKYILFINQYKTRKNVLNKY
jgi:hypothetical protein